MNQLKERTEIRFLYIFITFSAVIFSWLIHEFAHLLTGEFLGNDMQMTLNTCYPIAGKYVEEWHGTIISAAGPAITLIEAFVFYYLLKRSSSKLLFPFLLTCLYMRSLAGVMNFIKLNDEGRISKALGIGSFTLPFLVFGVLLYLVYSIVVTKKYNTRFITITTLLIMLFSSILILTDQSLKIIVV